MNLENSIERLYRELNVANNGINGEYTDMYSQYIDNAKLQLVFSTMHFWLTNCFSCLNQRLPTGDCGAHFWAEPSRDLIRAIELADDIIKTFKATKYSCNYDEYYKNIISQCKEFLSSSGGSSVPPYFEKIELYYTIPIFTFNDTVIIASDPLSAVPLKYKAGGSYADVSFYFDEFYSKNIAVKTAHKNLSSKELERFRKEFDIMRSLSSPYIVEVYSYDENKNRYTMEYIDITLKDYIEKNNANLTLEQKKAIINQILYAFKYLHSKQILHRDISPKNVLIKQYDDLIVVKISDFGLVKIPESTLTSASTEFHYCNLKICI